MHRKIISLANGKRIANFSSPHPFTFDDGTVLGAVSDDIAQHLKTTIVETVHQDGSGDIELTITLSESVQQEMAYWMEHRNEVDVVFCPLMIVSAIKETHGMEYLKKSPFRTTRLVDRVTKVNSSEKQCL
jgi:hypothetical protein